MARCRELNGEIVAGAAKVQAALKLSDEDQARRGSAGWCVKDRAGRGRVLSAGGVSGSVKGRDGSRSEEGCTALDMC